VGGVAGGVTVCAWGSRGSADGGGGMLGGAGVRRGGVGDGGGGGGPQCGGDEGVGVGLLWGGGGGGTPRMADFTRLRELGRSKTGFQARTHPKFAGQQAAAALPISQRPGSTRSNSQQVRDTWNVQAIIPAAWTKRSSMDPTVFVRESTSGGRTLPLLKQLSWL